MEIESGSFIWDEDIKSGYSARAIGGEMYYEREDIGFK